MQPVGARSALERVFPSTESDVTDEDEDKTISSLIARSRITHMDAVFTQSEAWLISWSQ